MNKSLTLVDENGNEHNITQLNLRSYFGRELKCSCGGLTSFEELPWSCSHCGNDTPTLLIVRPCDWWHQPRLEHARVLLIGCGAIGNEVAKNLVLLGIKHMTLVDFDKIEVHNLNRSVLFHKDAREKAKTHYKVDVMKVALEGLNPSVDITALNTGVLDHTTKRTKNFTEWVDDPLDRERLIRLGLQHDLCVIATDGFAPRAFIAGVLYLVMPIVQSSMNETGTLAQIKVSLPGVTGCVQCPTTSDPIHYFSDGEPNWQSTDRQYGANRCKDAAEAMGAASFAHTNSMAASFAVSQAVLLLKGWKNYTAEGCWPANLPVPLWNEVAYPRPFSPGGSRNSKTSDNVELFLETSPNGDYICYCCRKGFVDGGRLLLRAWGLMDIAEKNNLSLWFNDISQIPRLGDVKGAPRPDKTVRFGKK